MAQLDDSQVCLQQPLSKHSSSKGRTRTPPKQGATERYRSAYLPSSPRPCEFFRTWAGNWCVMLTGKPVRPTETMPMLNILASLACLSLVPWTTEGTGKTQKGGCGGRSNLTPNALPHPLPLNVSLRQRLPCFAPERCRVRPTQLSVPGSL